MLSGLVLASMIAVADAPEPPFPQNIVTAFRGLLSDYVRDYAALRVKAAYSVPSIGEDGKPDLAFCVLANAKNGFGGYLGYRWIYVSYDRKRREPVVTDYRGLQDLCEKAGGPDRYNYAADFAPDHHPATE